MGPENDLKKIRYDILRMVRASGEGHIPSSFSVLEILYALYSRMDANDEFFLSKGHASAALYVILAHFGLLEKKDIETFCEYTSTLGGHPSNKVKHVLSSSGSLGHGLPMAVGYALGKRIRGESGVTFCLIGDGEANEGSIWEAAMHAVHLDLSNLVCVVDDNNSQTRAMVSINLLDKFESFGWRTLSVDGHDLKELTEALFDEITRKEKRPLCIIARTIKGKGLKEMEENSFSWHHKAPSEEELTQFERELLV